MALPLLVSNTTSNIDNNYLTVTTPSFLFRARIPGLLCFLSPSVSFLCRSSELKGRELRSRLDFECINRNRQSMSDKISVTATKTVRLPCQNSLAAHFLDEYYVH